MFSLVPLWEFRESTLKEDTITSFRIFQIHRPLIIFPFDVAKFRLLTTSLNKPKINLQITEYDPVHVYRNNFLNFRFSIILPYPLRSSK
jgi:hypothetical protein